jgi:thiamine-monophosphate kinase
MADDARRGAGEGAVVARLAALFGGDLAPGVTVGIGDDAAVLRPPPGRDLVWTVDTQVEGRHFRRAWLTLEQVGYRSFVAAASDLFAMGADPWCALGALAVPESLDADAIDAVALGQARAAREVGCPIVGGNLTRAGELSVTTTLLGTTPRAVTRGGARPGDGVYLAGEVGLARAGLLALERGLAGDAAFAAALDAFRSPRVRVAAGRAVGARASAAIDLSDGLAEDARRLATASGTAIVFDLEALAALAQAELGAAAARLGLTPLALALEGGEDYALLATASEPLDGFHRIGTVEPGAGVSGRSADGARHPVDVRGFDHFEAPRA